MAQRRKDAGRRAPVAPPRGARERSVEELVALLDSDLLRALTEPARLELLEVLMRLGPADVGAVAAQLPQDRSVISRHLASLHAVGLLRVHKDGRRRVYAVDGQAFLAHLDGLLGRARALVQVCCPPDASGGP